MKRFILCAAVLCTGYLFGAADAQNQAMDSFVRVFSGAEGVLPRHTIRGAEKKRTWLQDKKQQVVLVAYQDEVVRNITLDNLACKATLRPEQVYAGFKASLVAADVSNLKNLQLLIAIFKFKQAKKPKWRIELCNGTKNVHMPDYVPSVDLKQWFETTQYLSVDTKTLEVSNFLDEEHARELFGRPTSEARTELLRIWQVHLEETKRAGFIVNVARLQQYYTRNSDDSCSVQ